MPISRTTADSRKRRRDTRYLSETYVGARQNGSSLVSHELHSTGAAWADKHFGEACEYEGE
jgi:hypothetical protein